MGLGTKEIKRALNRPEITYPAPSLGRHRVHRTVYVEGRLAVLVDDRDGITVTILWRGTERYDREVSSAPDPA